MKNCLGRILLVLAISAFLAVLPGASVNAFADDTITVTGVLTLDAEGGMIIKSGGKTYLVEGEGLEDKLDQKVTLTGVVETTGDGALFLIVE
jgi:hypothetical protein